MEPIEQRKMLCEQIRMNWTLTQTQIILWLEDTEPNEQQQQQKKREKQTNSILLYVSSPIFVLYWRARSILSNLSLQLIRTHFSDCCYF